MRKTAEELDRKIWKAYQELNLYSSNPEIYIKPFREITQEYSNQQLAEFKEKLKKGISNMYIGTTLQQHVPVAKFIELIDSL